MRIGSCRERHRRTRRGSRIVIPRCEATWESRSTRPHRGKAIGKIATACPRLPWAQSALAMTNLLALRHRIRAAKPTACKALNPRKGDAASVRRQSRQRLRSERCYRRNRLVRFYRQPVRIGSAFPRLPRAQSALAMTSLGALHIRRKYLQICSCQRRSLTAATDAIGAYRFHGGLYKSAVPSRDCHVASLLAMTNLEALTAHIASLHGGHCPMDKSDIPGFARSDIFLSESDIKASRLL